MTPDPIDELGKRLFEAARGESVPEGAEERVIAAARRMRELRRSEAPSVSSRGVWGYVLLAAVLASVVLFLARRREPAVAITQEPSRPNRVESPPPVAPEKASAAVLPAPPEVRSSTPVPRLAPPVTLADELGTLKNAENALATGDVPGALKALDHYDRVLKGKQMRAEATLLRMEALSRGGRPEAAAALGARFVRENPESPLVDRARSFMSKASDGGRQP